MSNTFIVSELRKRNWNLSKTARNLGLDYGDLKRQHGTEHKPVVVPRGPIPTDYKALGKESLRRHVIAVKKCTTEWPMQFHNAIQKARLNFDAGTHTMCQQTRPDGWVVLYSVPHKVPVRPRRFFYGSRDQ